MATVYWPHLVKGYDERTLSFVDYGFDFRHLLVPDAADPFFIADNSFIALDTGPYGGGPVSDNYNGTFIIDGVDITDGTVNSLNRRMGGELVGSVSGLELPFKELSAAATTEDKSDDMVLWARAFAGDDVLTGSGAADRLEGFAGNDTMSSGAGHDLLEGGLALDHLNGGADNDSLYGEDGDDVLTGEHGADRLFGGLGLDHLNGGDGDDSLYGEDGNDVLTGELGADRLSGGAGDDIVSAASGNDWIYGELGNDTMFGGAGRDLVDGGLGLDSLTGGTGNDTLHGRSDDDRLIGNQGADRLFGEAGRDTFVFTSIRDSTVKATGRDTIYDFSFKQKDQIDLTAIDASTKANGNQAFKYISKQDFHDKAGELRWEKVKAGVYVYGDVNGDGNADFSLLLRGITKLTKGDFFL
ncbi:calcium-binding protein [Microvirga sp. 0TCS3.31]